MGVVMKAPPAEAEGVWAGVVSRHTFIGAAQVRRPGAVTNPSRASHTTGRDDLSTGPAFDCVVSETHSRA